MKRISLITALLLTGIVSQALAKDGYHIVLKMPGVKDSMAFLAHYYGKNRPTIFKTDSSRFDKSFKLRLFLLHATILFF